MNSKMVEILDILRRSPENVFFPGATEDRLLQIEKNLGVVIPDSYRDFLRQSDGATLYETEEILGTVDDPSTERQSVVALKAELEKSGLLPSRNFIPFHRGAAMLHCFSPDGSASSDYPVVSLTLDGKNLSDNYQSFEEFLQKYIIEFQKQL